MSGTTSPRTLLAIATCLAAAGLAATGAAAAPVAAATGSTIRANDGNHTIEYVAGSGQNNRPSVSVSQGEPVGEIPTWVYTVVDHAPIAAGTGCHHPQAANLNVVSCVLREGGDFYPVVHLRLGDRVDRLMSLPAMDIRVYGGPGDDVLISPHAILRGEAGNDILVSDYADGGPGNDRLTGVRYGLGGPGNDRITGYQDPAEETGLHGGPGNDTIDGGPGLDTVYGNSGRDVIRGLQGRDTLYGGPDADTMYGNGGDDRLVGGPGRDVLSGGPGRDVVRQ